MSWIDWENRVTANPLNPFAQYMTRDMAQTQTNKTTHTPLTNFTQSFKWQPTTSTEE